MTMDEVDNDYLNGIIYKIVCNITGEVYIGSTKNKLGKRMGCHKQEATCTSRQIIARGDYTPSIIENYPCMNRSQLRWRERHFMETMECINTIPPIVSREEELAKLKKWRHDNAEKVKRDRATYAKENKEARAAANKKWRDDNKEHCIEKSRQYREKNKESIAAFNKKWREENADKVKADKAKYYEDNKKAISDRGKLNYQENAEKHRTEKVEYYKKLKAAGFVSFTCGCGGKYTSSSGSKNRHEQSKKHLKWITDSLA